MTRSICARYGVLSLASPAVAATSKTIPTKGHVCPNALFNLPLRGNATQKARQHVLYHDHRVNGRPAILLIVSMSRFFVDKG